MIGRPPLTKAQSGIVEPEIRHDIAFSLGYGQPEAIFPRVLDALDYQGKAELLMSL
ncbi:MAG: hypothetical protein KQH59_18625 [Desulfobulbaceae bacterium]|nr:hypothetical protein [Desulfobulbaceae bacterium]